MTKQPDLLKQQVELAPYTSMKIGGRADYFVPVMSRDDVKAACDWAAEEGLPVFVLGEGSNIVIDEKPVHRVVLKVEVPGFEVVAEDDVSVKIKVGAGEHWDDVVKRTVDMGLAGLEAMSMIAGTAGAAPVQNAGAYGQEAADTLVEVEAYNLVERVFVKLSRDECGFGYRTSRFKTDWVGRYVICNVTLALSKGGPAEVRYASLKRWLEEQGVTKPSLEQIREGVMAVRARILPDPSVVPNAGSFFKNPIVSAQTWARLRGQFDGLPAYEHGDNYKLAAGWLLDQCGFKGTEHFGLKLWSGHALVITNPNGAAYADLMKLVDLMVTTVEEKFGVRLEMEPVFVS